MRAEDDDATGLASNMNDASPNYVFGKFNHMTSSSLLSLTCVYLQWLLVVDVLKAEICVSYI